jgi:hypothetical protein
MPTFIDMSKLTKRSTLTGNEEFQVSATEKATSRQIANLFNAMQAKLTGFVNRTTGATSITSASTILQAFQNMYRIVGNGAVKIITNGAAYNGFVCWAGSTCYGIVFNIVDNIIYSRNGFTQDPPTALTDQQWIDTIVNNGLAFRMDADMTPLNITDFKATVNNARVQKLPVGGIIPFYSAGGDQKPTSEALIGILQKVSAGQINYFAQDVGSNNFYIGNAITTLIKWTQIGAGGSGIDVIAIEGGERIGKQIISADWGDKAVGKIKAILVTNPTALIEAYFPLFKVPAVAFMSGFVQCLQSGSDRIFSATMYPVRDDGTLITEGPSYVMITIGNDGNVLDYLEYPSVILSPIPGYKELVSEWSLITGTTTGALVTVNFDREIPRNAKIMLCGSIRQTSDPTSDAFYNIPLTVPNIDPDTGQGVLVEVSSVHLSSSSDYKTVGTIRLLVVSFKTRVGTTGAVGLNLLVQRRNIDSTSSSYMFLKLYSNY